MSKRLFKRKDNPRLTGEGGVVVLVLLPDAGQVAHDGYADLLEKLGATNTRALEDLGRAKRTGREHDVLVRADLSFDASSVRALERPHEDLLTMVSLYWPWCARLREGTYATPTARSPSKMMRETRALVRR